MTAEVRQLPTAQRPPDMLEAMVIGGLVAGFTDAALLDALLLQQEDFRETFYRTSFRVIEVLAREGVEVNVATVFARGDRLRVMGHSHMMRLAELPSMIFGREQLHAIARDLRWRNQRQVVIEQLGAIASSLRSPGYDEQQLRGQLAGVLDFFDRRVGVDARASRALIEAAEEIEQREAGKLVTEVRVPTALVELDDCISRAPAKLCVIAGQPQHGKSALAGSMILGACFNDPNHHDGLISLEDGERWLTDRALAGQLGVEVPKLYVKGAISPQALGDAMQVVGPVLERVHTWTPRAPLVTEVIDHVRAWLQLGVKRVFIDHLGRMAHSYRKGEQSGKAIERTIDTLAAFADEVKIPIVLLAHTARPEDKSDRERPPKLFEMAGSAAIERGARLVLGAWIKEGRTRATVLKNTMSTGRGSTLEFEDVPGAFLVKPTGAKLINLIGEQAAERRARKSEAEGESVEATLRKRAKLKEAEAKLKAAEEAAKPKPEPQPQLGLQLPEGKS
jgi:replicative DNA helicase